MKIPGTKGDKRKGWRKMGIGRKRKKKKRKEA